MPSHLAATTRRLMPGLEDRAREVVEEECRIVGCMIAELLEGRGERICGCPIGPDPHGERLRLISLQGGVPQRAARFLELAVVDVA
jgi:hypothetical protein